MADQPITVTVDGIASTLRRLTDAGEALHRYKSMYTSGPDAVGYSAGFRGSLDFAIRRFEQSVTELQKQLLGFRDEVRSTGEEFIALDTEYADLHTNLNAQLAAASTVTTPPRNVV